MVKDDKIQISCSYDNGKKNGPYIENYSSGFPHIRRNFVNDEKNGEYFEFYPGPIYLLHKYCSGHKENGIYATFDKKGELEKESCYTV